MGHPYIMQEYEGVYVYQSTKLEVKSEKNQLLLSGSGEPAVLAYKEPLRFQVIRPTIMWSVCVEK